MRVVVCVKPVPSAAASQRFDVAAGRADRSGPMEINAPDLYAVEEALRIRDLVGGEVVALAMTPESGFDSLRTPVAMGVDRAVAISDAALEGSDLVVTARVLAAAIALEAPSLVLFGAEAEDGGGAMLWAAVAERLRLPVVSSAHEVQAADGSIRVTCRRSDSVDTVEVPLPCVISISSSASTPRYPTLKGIMAAKRKPIEARSLADIGLAERGPDGLRARTMVLRVAPAPPRRGHGQVIKDDGAGAGVGWLAQFIAERRPL